MTTLVKWQRKTLPMALLMALGLISPITQALSPPNLQTNIPHNATPITVSDVIVAFNTARRQEEIQLGLAVNTLGKLKLPATWDAMSDDAKALYLINAERTARANMYPGVIGLPLAGVESHVAAASKAYANLLIAQNQFGHYAPSGNSTIDNPTKRIAAQVGANCMEFLTRSENLQISLMSIDSTVPLTDDGWPRPIERAIYDWLYDDSYEQWGHREALLLQDSPLSNPTSTAGGYKNNNGSSSTEGFLGIARAGSNSYWPFNPPNYPNHYAQLVVMNIFDPVPDMLSISANNATTSAAGCAYNVTMRTEDLPAPSTANLPPSAVYDTVSVASGATITINPLDNDGDPDDDPLTLTSITNPDHGTATRNGNSISYTAKAGYTGSDYLNYTVSDSKGNSATGSVYITVTNSASNQPPKAVNDTATTTAGQSVTLNVLANDSDPDGNTLTVTANTTPANGTVTRKGGNVTYTPKAGFTGTDSFSYTISDGKGGTATGTVTITVKSTVNQPPKAVNDSVGTAYNTSVNINVLTNDSDPEGDALSIKSVTKPSNGKVQVVGNTLTYTPNKGFSGTDSFNYTITDGKNNTATATVMITVKGNNKPVAGNDTVSTGYAQPVTINVLSNDSDADQDPLTIKSNTAPSKGKVKLAGNSFIYTPNKNASGVDTFTYTISDGKDGTATGTVTINIAANKNPIAVNDTASGFWHKTIPITINVLANDSDPEGQPLSITSFTQPAYGKVTKQGTSLVFKNPAIPHYGKDSFQYTISDGNGGTATATVNLTISSPL